MTGIRKGTEVEWKYGKGTATGKVEETFTDKVTKEIKGKEITRNATKDEPAYLVKQEDGAEALKKDSEVHKAK
ncbi:DUF2945 domain-containing protein [Aureimonas pseudogalii]|jgi:hypothetical protein|uniref:Hypervirulence associated protein TUDOR domain-containing protein n=1 Tax=Aureimonas pseudogalii TaxID=1744844 RepID=A0A7W6H241_9HYPH|nr:DUF2945 domain-containing protein [Aureimonas pseudogalii]MBB3996631.1 hypothetical protein [Aureimonas pseudogalii]